MKQITLRTLAASFICALLCALAGNAQAQTSCVQPPKGQTQWYPGDGSAADFVENINGTLKNGASFAPGLVGQAFSLDGVDDHMQVNFSPLPGTFSALSFEVWIKPANIQTGRITDKAAPGGTSGFFPELSAGHLRAAFGANTATTALKLSHPRSEFRFLPVALCFARANLVR